MPAPSGSRRGYRYASRRSAIDRCPAFGGRADYWQNADLSRRHDRRAGPSSRLAPLSFIGGSLVAHGGQNPIEAIKLGSGILSGPHTFNFAETYSVLQRFEGFKLVAGPEDLAAELKRLFENPAEAEEMKHRAAAAIGTLGGALEKTLEALKPYLPAAPQLAATPAERTAGHAA